MRPKRTMFRSITIITIIILASLTSCQSVYWKNTKRTASGKHTYYKPGWPYQYSCRGVYNRNPIKMGTMRRYHFANQKVRE